MRFAEAALALLFFASTAASALSPRPAVYAAKPHKWRLVWSDEFNYSGKPDPRKWQIDSDKNGWGDGELEHYSDSLENVRVENGHLVLQANLDGPQKYSSGRIHMKAPGFTYGRFEIRAKFPSGDGTWPAIWMMAPKVHYGSGVWPDNGEIDIAEHVGREPDQLLGNFYTKNFIWMNNTGISKVIDFPGTESEFHIYVLEWDKDQAEISVDGIVYNVFKNPHTTWEDWPFDQNLQLILNLALGSFGGDMDDSVLPQQLQIDYVRIFQLAN
jgi:beta-glucanase (GH16 family)